MTAMQDLFIIAGLRTPFIRMGTDFAGLSAADLGRHVCAALLLRTGIDPAEIDEVILGCVAQPIDSANVARVIALRSGVPKSVPAVTVNRNCASGMEAVTTAQCSPARMAGKLATEELLPRFFDGRIHHHITQAFVAKP